ncbi:MAG: metallophosphoesterase family protein [Ginsengibacter sp.]
MDEHILAYCRDCDEIWHAGDFGNEKIADQLASVKPLTGVYGNIDGYDITSMLPETLFWRCEEVTVLMKHIGGYPPKYTTEVKALIAAKKPKLFISGHSHILKIMYDDKMDCLHINPGAAGNHGWQKVRTMVRFTIDKNDIKDCEVIELGGRK